MALAVRHPVRFLFVLLAPVFHLIFVLTCQRLYDWWDRLDHILANIAWIVSRISITGTDELYFASEVNLVHSFKDS